jgi:hypothetical protein
VEDAGEKATGATIDDRGAAARFEAFVNASILACKAFWEAFICCISRRSAAISCFCASASD